MLPRTSIFAEFLFVYIIVYIIVYVIIIINFYVIVYIMVRSLLCICKANIDLLVFRISLFIYMQNYADLCSL